VAGRKIKAISLHQPWASLIARGYKKYETRSWPTSYRGPIAIHAAKKFLHVPQLLQLLGKKEKSDFPLGAVVAIADLTDCLLMDWEFIQQFLLLRGTVAEINFPNCLNVED
jgi:activating signal cointegrator 1